MATISKLKVGQVLYTVSRSRAGNTTLRTVNVHEVIVRSIDPEGRYVVASWNWNQPEKYGPHDVGTWKVSKPVTIRSSFGTHRLATREEKKALLAKHPGDSSAG